MDERKSSDPPPEPTPTPHAGGRERNTILERLVKRSIESGIEAISKSEDAVRSLVDTVKLPKEAASVVIDQIDETKRGLYTVVAKEIRDFLQTTNFAGDVKKILTGLAFEVKMEVRFKEADNPQADAPPVLRPDVQAQAAVKSTRKRRAQPTPEAPPDTPREPEKEPLK
jgi:predicted YcjX-like family ATPase